MSKRIAITGNSRRLAMRQVADMAGLPALSSMPTIRAAKAEVKKAKLKMQAKSRKANRK